MTSDLQSLVDAYADALTSFHARPTDCPGWSVREQVAHVLALELQLSGHPLPPRLAA
jgi:hypothetical protein